MYCVSAAGSGSRSIRERQVGGDDPFGVVAGVHVHHAVEAADQQAGAGQQDERRRDLRGDEGVANEDIAASRRARASAFLQRVGSVAPRRAQRRRQAEGHAREHRDDGEKPSTRPSMRDAGLRRKVERRQQALDPPQQPVAERDAEQTRRVPRAAGSRSAASAPGAGGWRRARDAARSRASGASPAPSAGWPGWRSRSAGRRRPRPSAPAATAASADRRRGRCSDRRWRPSPSSRPDSARRCRPAIALISACACSKDTPGFSRATALR